MTPVHPLAVRQPPGPHRAWLLELAARALKLRAAVRRRPIPCPQCGRTRARLVDVSRRVDMNGLPLQIYSACCGRYRAQLVDVAVPDEPDYSAIVAAFCRLPWLRELRFQPIEFTAPYEATLP